MVDSAQGLRESMTNLKLTPVHDGSNFKTAESQLNTQSEPAD